MAVLAVAIDFDHVYCFYRNTGNFTFRGTWYRALDMDPTLRGMPHSKYRLLLAPLFFLQNAIVSLLLVTLYSHLLLDFVYSYFAEAKGVLSKQHGPSFYRIRQVEIIFLFFLAIAYGYYYLL